jgi:hypothetical protein
VNPPPTQGGDSLNDLAKLDTLSQKAGDPFTSYIQAHEKNSLVTGTVKSIDAKGAIIQLDTDVEGYLRASEVSRDRVEDIRILSEDKGLEKLLGGPFPSPDALLDFLGQFHDSSSWEQRPPGKKAYVPVESDGLRARGEALPVFDSTVEEAFARRFGEERDGWRLSREATVVEVGKALFIPDFTFTHADGTTVLLEIVGYWRSEYVEEKFRKLAGVSGTHLIVAVPRRLAARATEVSGAVIEFRTRLRIGDVVAALEGLRWHLGMIWPGAAAG